MRAVDKAGDKEAQLVGKEAIPLIRLNQVQPLRWWQPAVISHIIDVEADHWKWPS